MALTVEPTGATLGAFVTGVDLAELDDATYARIEDAWHEHGVLIFPGQHPSDETQAAFGERVGRLERFHSKQTAKVTPISNRKPDGTLLKPEDYGSRLQRGNEGWHTDSSYMPVSARASILSAHVVPPQGGQTEWADMRAAYEALDEVTRRRIEGLSAHHSLFHSQARIGHQVAVGAGYGFYEGEAPLRPLVKVHPVTGRKSLFIGRHAYGIPGLDEDESERLLTELVTFACQPPRTYRHDWRPGDMVIWDNRCVLHRACPYDTTKPRVLRHTRVAGDPATETALNYPINEEGNLGVLQ